MFWVLGQSKKPQKPKATTVARATRARLRARQARVSRVRFTVCVCVLLCYRYGGKPMAPEGANGLASVGCVLVLFPSRVRCYFVH